MHTPPGHRFDIIERDLEGIQGGSIPMLFEDAPTTFDRVIFAVIGRIVGQANREAGLVGELHDPLHKLGAPTMAFGAVIQRNQQRCGGGETGVHDVPPGVQPIDEAVTCHRRGDPGDEQFVGVRHQDADGGHCRFGLEVVVTGLRRHPIHPAPGERTEGDRSFGVHGDAEGLGIRRGGGQHLR